MTPSQCVVVDRIATVDEYLKLRESVGWVSPARAKCNAALAQSLFGVLALCDGDAVGMGRVIGDNALYATIVDVVVAQNFQRLGIGKRVVDRLTGWSAASGIPHVGLVADDHLLKYYAQWPLRDSGRYLRLWRG